MRQRQKRRNRVVCAKTLFVLGLGLFELAVSVPVHAQITASATAQGTIMDQTRAVLPGAEITITNKMTGLTRTAVSNESGIYRFDLMPAGMYQIRANLAGFNTQTK